MSEDQVIREDVVPPLVLDNLPRELMDPQNELARWMWTSATSYQLIRQESLNQFSHFVKVLQGIDVSPFLQEIKSEHWHVNVRQTIQAQRHTQAIALRNCPKAGLTSRNNIQDSQETAFAAEYPKLMEFLYKFAKMVNGELSRAMLVKLSPLEQVYPHFDMGYYYLVRDRYHLVLQSVGSLMLAGGEQSIWYPGEVWWFNNKVNHEAKNQGDSWRIHVIFDVLPFYMKPWVEKLKAVR